MSPPPGLPQDRALWQTMVETQNAIVAHRDFAARQLQRLNVARYDLRLEALAKTVPPERAEEIGKIKTRFVEVWHESYRALATPWPIHWHTGCRYQRLNLEAAMEGAMPQIEAARAEARECLAKQAPTLKAMQETNKSLQAAVAEVEAVLATSPAAKPEGGASPVPASGRSPPPEPEPPAGPKAGGK
jgi:hypothetical protein